MRGFEGGETRGRAALCDARRLQEIARVISKASVDIVRVRFGPAILHPKDPLMQNNQFIRTETSSVVGAT